MRGSLQSKHILAGSSDPGYLETEYYQGSIKSSLAAKSSQNGNQSSTFADQYKRFKQSMNPSKSGMIKDTVNTSLSQSYILEGG